MPPDPPREQGPPGLATPTQINATPTSKTVENPVSYFLSGTQNILSNNVLYIIVVFLKVSDCKKVDLNV